jgi:hypothetical protein
VYREMDKHTERRISVWGTVKRRLFEAFLCGCRGFENARTRAILRAIIIVYVLYNFDWNKCNKWD